MILISFILATANGHSQNNGDFTIVSHQVQMGETVRTISKKYLTSPADIYQLNKFAVDGISQGMILQIPVPYREEKSNAHKTSDNTVQTEEYLEKTPYNPNTEKVYVAETRQSEPIVKSLEKVDKKSENEQNSVNLSDESGTIEHVVLAGQTLFSLAKQYGTTVDQIKHQNPALLKKGLQVGQILQFGK